MNGVGRTYNTVRFLDWLTRSANDEGTGAALTAEGIPPASKSVVGNGENWAELDMMSEKVD